MSLAAAAACAAAGGALVAAAAAAAAAAARARAARAQRRLCQDLRARDLAAPAEDRAQARARARVLRDDDDDDDGGGGDDYGDHDDDDVHFSREAQTAVAALRRVRASWETCRAQRLSEGSKMAMGATIGADSSSTASISIASGSRWYAVVAAASGIICALRDEIVGELPGAVAALMAPHPVEAWGLLGPVPRGSRVKLVLDLDETLVHTFVGAPSLLMRLGGVECAPVTVILSNQFVHIRVALRPYVREFLRLASQWFDLAVFTAGDRSYADPIIDFLDEGRGILLERYYRHHCQTVGGYHLKDLRVVSSDLSRIAIIDDNETGALLNPNNCVGIKSWLGNPFDRALVDLLPGLAVLSRAPSTVPAILSI